MPSPHVPSDSRAAAPATRLDRSFDRFLAHGQARAARKGAPKGTRPEATPGNGEARDGERRDAERRDGERRYV